jgi:PTH1 family peptidyl-tRNA hydrolase
MFFRKKSSENTYLIAGLGNPGREYLNTRHNAGFMVLDTIAQRFDVRFSRMQANALVTKVIFHDKKIILAKPRTFMNKSGQAIGALTKFYKIPPENIIVIYDDVDLPLETLRIRPDGGSGGHKGMKSIIERLGHQNFPRLRIGIGRPKGQKSTPNHVLQEFTKEEAEILPAVLDRAADATMTFLSEGITNAMNQYNPKMEEL